MNGCQPFPGGGRTSHGHFAKYSPVSGCWITNRLRSWLCSGPLCRRRRRVWKRLQFNVVSISPECIATPLSGLRSAPSDWLTASWETQHQSAVAHRLYRQTFTRKIHRKKTVKTDKFVGYWNAIKQQANSRHPWGDMPVTYLMWILLNTWYMLDVQDGPIRRKSL